MPYIKVNTNSMRNYSTELNAISSNILRINNDFYARVSEIDRDVLSLNNIVNDSNGVIDDLNKSLSVAARMAHFVGEAASIYSQMDSTQDLGNGNASDLEPMPFEMSADETDKILEELATANGVPKEQILEDIKNGSEKAGTWLGYLGTGINGIQSIFGASDLKFRMADDGNIILSGFTRDSKLNKWIKNLDDAGIGTRYSPKELYEKPFLGGLYVLDRIEKTATVLNYTALAVNTGAKIAEVLADDTKSSQKKACDVTAIAVTTAASIALDVAAPIAGKAVTTAVTAALSFVPGVNVVAGVVAGKAVEFVIGTAAEVIRSEEVVNQVSDSFDKMTSAVKSGAEAVSNAGKELLESKNVGDAVKNTLNLVGTAVVANAQVVATTVVETAKVVATVVKETAKAVVNKVKNFFKGW